MTAGTTGIEWVHLDLFHENVPDEFIARVFATMALSPRHTFQVLTKRPERMRDILTSEDFPHAVARAIDAIEVARAIRAMGEERVAPIAGFPGYLVTDRGRILRQGASHTCLWCGEPLPEEKLARSKFCSQRCNAKAHYEKTQGRWEPPVDVAREMRPDVGEQGHRRVQLISPDGTPQRIGVHRLVLTAFDRPPLHGEQGCHRDGDPSNNALPNLRWGSQSENWSDRVRHGNHRTHRRREAAITWVKPDLGFAWPLPNCWAGVSIENARHTWRADVLREIPAAVRFISAEPLLGSLYPKGGASDEAQIHHRGRVEPGQVRPGAHGGAGGVDGRGLRGGVRGRRDQGELLDGRERGDRLKAPLDLTGISWLIVGGESGPGARPMHPNWARELRDACLTWGNDHGVPETRPAFFFKQIGGQPDKRSGDKAVLDGRTWTEMPDAQR